MGRIIVDPPGLFWASADDDPIANPFAPETGTVVPFWRNISYKEDSGPFAAFDGLLREVISANAFRRHIRSFARAGPDARFVDSVFTDEFASKLLAPGSGIVQRSVRPAQLFPTLEQFEVAASASLRGEMAIVNRGDASLSGFSAPLIASYAVTIKADERGADEVTPEPAGKACAPHLEDDGIARVGAEVGSEDVLVGLHSNRFEQFEGIPQEELLMSIIKGATADVSLRMPRYASGRVLAVDIQVQEKQHAAAFRPRPGRTIRVVSLGDLAVVSRVTVTVSLNEPIRPGDVLYDNQHSRAVVLRLPHLVRSKPRVRIEGRRCWWRRIIPGWPVRRKAEHGFAFASARPSYSVSWCGAEVSAPSVSITSARSSARRAALRFSVPRASLGS
jgi:hypothetical protein